PERVKEVLWTLLLALAYRSRRTTPLADVLALKWAASYICFIFVDETAPIYTDFAVGMIGVVVAVRHNSFRGDCTALL
ncbi:hypothetical protein ABTD17_19220, partial [Acinetobacter baumannii]